MKTAWYLTAPRRATLQTLSQTGSMTVLQLAAARGSSESAAGHHLRSMSRHGVVEAGGLGHSGWATGLRPVLWRITPKGLGLLGK